MDKSGKDSVAISIVMPVYNCKKYLSDAIDSVLAQSFCEWELIIIDDGSTDGSGLICDLYCQKDSRVKVFHTENRGVSMARNYGIQQAKGMYVEFMDGDDLLFPNALQRMYELIGESDLLVFGFETFPVKNVNCISETKRYCSQDDLGEDFSELASVHLINSPCNKLYRRECIVVNKLNFPEEITMGEDLLFNLSYMQCCQGITVIPEVLYGYRREEKGTLSTRFRKDCIEIQRLLKEETDKGFKYHKGVVGHTSIDFVNSVIENMQACVYTQAMKKREKIELIAVWLNDEYFIRLFRSVRDKDLMAGDMLKSVIEKKRSHYIYYGFRCRKVLSTIRKKFFNNKKL